MRRITMFLGSVGLIALGFAATPAPAQAHDGWSGYPAAREQAWRGHERHQHYYWHPSSYEQGDYAPHRHFGSSVTLIRGSTTSQIRAAGR